MSSGGAETGGDAGADYDRLAAHLDPAMAIVTAAVGDETTGCLVGFHSQCSIEPRLHAVWVSKANHSHHLAVRAEHLAVHLVPRGARDLAVLFGSTSGDRVDKFAGVDWSPGPGGVPLIDRLPSRLVGRRRSVLEHGGDHTCVVVEPVLVEGADVEAALVHLSGVDELEPGHEADDDR